MPVTIYDSDELRTMLAGLGVEWCLVARNHLPLVRPDEVRLCGIWITPTAELLKLVPPDSSLVHHSTHEGTAIRLYATELGEALRRLLKGDSWLLDAVFSHRNLISSETHEHLVERVRDGLHLDYVDHYLTRAAELERRPGAFTPDAAARLLLQAGHLARTGQVATATDELARYRDVSLDDDLDLDLLRTHTRGAARVLPRNHPHPTAFDEFLLFVREARF